jgi:hypothetical protein
LAPPITEVRRWPKAAIHPDLFNDHAKHLGFDGRRNAPPRSRSAASHPES